MGRTQRIRKKRQISKENEPTKVIQLQKAIKLKCPKIQINYFDNIGWGVRCKKKIEAGEILIALPLHLLITTNTHCEVYDVLGFDDRPPQFFLSIFLMYELHLDDKSKYVEYIQSLPQFYLNPYFCTKEEIEVLPEFIKKDVISQIKLLNDNIEKLFQNINDQFCSHCGKKINDIFTYEKFVWAWFTVNTRSVYYENSSQTKSLALAPFLDLFNHSNDAVTNLLIDFENKLYILKTLISFKKFDQVFIKYGAHSNLKLYLEYGFILPQNENDFVEFSYEEVLESVKEFHFSFGELTKLKYNFIKSNKLSQNLTKGAEYSWNFQGLVYVLTTRDEDLSVLQAKTYSNLFTLTEKNTIQKVCEITSKKKCDELKRLLIEMEAINNCSRSFTVAKNLVKNYMRLLNF